VLSRRSVVSRAAGLAVLAFLSLAPAAPSLAQEATAARIEPIVIETDGGAQILNVEIADTPALQERGLMFRQRVPFDKGMLFYFGDIQEITMWMKNTLAPLDMIFIRADGSVAEIVENTKPLSLDVIRSQEKLPAVLELGAGGARRLGIRPGTLIRSPFFGNLG
jgi:uncharacterized membrane protein (UPF0127 family)